MLLGAPEQHAAFVGAQGVAFAPLPGAMLGLLESAEGKAAIAERGGFGAGRALLRQIRPRLPELYAAEWDAARRFAPDVLLYHPKSVVSPHIAEKLGRPAVLVSPLPGFTPTRAFPSPLLPFASLGPLNRLSHALAIRGGAQLFARELRAFRAMELGMPWRDPSPPSATLYAHSAHLVPAADDYGADVTVTGAFFLEETWSMPADLERFLGAGPPPVYVGFGSMPGIDADAFTRLVVQALERTGDRGLLAVGGGALALGALPPSVFAVGAAPHDRIFPLVRAAVHHGGAGTTVASLRAGRPTVICPFFGDQPFWGRRVHALGLGPAPLPRRSVTVTRLAEAIAATKEPRTVERAAAMGAQIRAERGLERATEILSALGR